MLALPDQQLAAVSIRLENSRGTANGTVYVYVEDGADAAPGRHGGAHQILKSGTIAGTVNMRTRAMDLAGTLTDNDTAAAQTSATVTGILKPSDTDLGAIHLTFGGSTHSGEFQ